MQEFKQIDADKFLDGLAKAGAAMQQAAQALKDVDFPIFVLDSFVPAHHRYMVEMSARRSGKSIVMEQMRRMNAGPVRAEELRAVRPAPFTIYHDEFYRAHLGHYEAIERDRSHFERGGRHRKPPVSKHVVTKEPGMVQVRARDGSLTWRKLGAGKAAR